MHAIDNDSCHSWTRPGPRPPGGVDLEPGETLDYISGHFRIFQLAKGHRFSVDDVLTAWYATTCAPRAQRIADLGSGIGSVAITMAWRLPGASFFTVEAQSESLRLARKSIRYNGLSERFTAVEGDLRDSRLFACEEPFDLVTGSPPYYPIGTATEASVEQAVRARMETRGTIADYATAAAGILAPGSLFATLFPTGDHARALKAIERANMVVLRSRRVIFREGEEAGITLYAASRRDDVPASFTNANAVEERPLTVRRRDGAMDREFAVIRMSFGFPPGPVAETS